MTVYAVSDLHGNLIEPPADADLLLLAGDICPDFGRSDGFSMSLDKTGARQGDWLREHFSEWLRAIPCPMAFIWGNHDFVGEHNSLVPSYIQQHLLQDQMRLVEGVRVWGTPWVPGLPYWAFYGSSEALESRANLIPGGLDVLMTHGPPRGHGDFIPTSEKQGNKYGNFGGSHVGDAALNLAIQRARPKVVICGHIHEARGRYELDGVPVVNVAAVDELYNLHESPWTRLYELEADE